MLRDARAGREVAEPLERRDPGRGEPLDLRPRDAGDERQVVVALPLLLAEREEVAEPAVLDRVRVGRRAALDRVEEARAEPPVEGEVVVRVEGLGLAGAGDDVHRARHRALDASDLLGVEAELEDVSRPSVPRELRVERLVAAVRLAHDEVGEPAPVAVDEGRLVDDRRAVAHRLLGLRERRRPSRSPRACRCERRPVAERGEVSGLVLVALAADQLGVRVVAVRLLELAARDGELEASSGAGRRGSSRGRRARSQTCRYEAASHGSIG